MSDSKAPYLSIEDIRKADDMKTFDVKVPEWGGVVKCKPFSMKERRAIRQVGETKSKRADGTISIEYDAEEIEIESLIQGVVDPEFKRSDRDWLMKEKSSGAISRVTQKILEASGMGGDSLNEQGTS